MEYRRNVAISFRLPAVERLLGCRIGDADETTLARLVDSGAVESEQLDFKATWTVSDDADELRKDVCAFANASGGLIIYGIRDEECVAVECTPFEPVGELGAQVANILFSGCRPVPRFELVVVRSLQESGRVYALLAVPASGAAPHARINNRQGYSLNFPVRFETTTQFLNESELAARYRTRFANANERLVRVIELENVQPIDAPSQSQTVAMRFCAVPSTPGEARALRIAHVTTEPFAFVAPVDQ